MHCVPCAERNGEAALNMESLYLLIPMSLLLVLALLALFGWALHGGQFDDLAQEGERIVQAEAPSLDADQAGGLGAPEQSALIRELHQNRVKESAR